MHCLSAHLCAGLLRFGFPAFGADFSFSSCPVWIFPSSDVGARSVSSRSPSTRTRTTTPPPLPPPLPSNDSVALSSMVPSVLSCKSQVIAGHHVCASKQKMPPEISTHITCFSSLCIICASTHPRRTVCLFCCVMPRTFLRAQQPRAVLLPILQIKHCR